MRLAGLTRLLLDIILAGRHREFHSFASHIHHINLGIALAFARIESDLLPIGRPGGPAAGHIGQARLPAAVRIHHPNIRLKGRRDTAMKSDSLTVGRKARVDEFIGAGRGGDQMRISAIHIHHPDVALYASIAAAREDNLFSVWRPIMLPFVFG